MTLHETILAEFRQWLTRTAEEVEAHAAAAPEIAAAANGAASAGAASAAAPQVGLRQLVEAFTALRHEVKLQTKSARGAEQQLQAAQQCLQAALQGLEQAMGCFQSAPVKEDEAAMRAALPLVQALVGIDEALWRGAKAFAAAAERLAREPAESPGDSWGENDANDSASRWPTAWRETIEREFAAQPWWRRWLARGWQARLTARVGALAEEAADAKRAEEAESAEEFEELPDEESPAARELALLRQGFELIVDRSRRTLGERGIQRFETLGQRADPSLMSVVEVVDDPLAEPETVVEEVRPGYSWRGQVVRYAEVRVAAKAPAEAPRVLALVDGEAADLGDTFGDAASDAPDKNGEIELAFADDDTIGER